MCPCVQYACVCACVCVCVCLCIQAPPEVLERIAGLLEGPSGSITLVERGDTRTVPRHPAFRLVAAMNPATDAGKRELPAALRNRLTEVRVLFHWFDTLH